MPHSVGPQLKEFVRQLMDYEAAVNTHPGLQQRPAFRVCEKLRQPLSRLAGTAGFRSLLSRALALANDEFHWLKALHVKADGSLEGLDDPQPQDATGDVSEGEIVLVAHLIGLLMTFIGKGLTLRLVQEAWPEGVFEDLKV